MDCGNAYYAISAAIAAASAIQSEYDFPFSQSAVHATCALFKFCNFQMKNKSKGALFKNAEIKKKKKRKKNIQKRKGKAKKRIEMVWRAVAVAANPFMIISQECRPLIKQVPIQA